MQTRQAPLFQPLSGLRVLDLSRAVSGPIAAHLLADLGAEVIKVERPAGDGLRHGVPAVEGDRPWDRVVHFNELHRGKLGVAIDFRLPLGRDLLERLLGASDLLIENFSRRAAQALGLTEEALAKRHPRLVAVSISAFGRNGPYAEWTAFGPGIDAASGLAALTAYPGGPPRKPANFFCDHLAGVAAAFAAITAIYRSRRTGRGLIVNVAMREVETPLVADALIDAGMNGRSTRVTGNRHPSFAPQGVYPCLGNDRWIAISVQSEHAWHAFCKAMDTVNWADDCRFSTSDARRRNATILDGQIGEVTARLEAQELMDRLAAVGVAAGVVNDVQGAVNDAQVRFRRNFVPADDVDVPGLEVRGALWKLMRSTMPINGPAPRFGQHNRRVLHDVLGLNEAEVAALYSAGIVVDQPRRGGPAD